AELGSIGYHLLRKQYDDVLKAIDRIDTVIGGDPYLNVLRAETLLSAEHFKEARAAAEKAIEEEPKLQQGYRHRIDIARKESNHADVVTWLKNLVEATGTRPTPAELEADERFTEFVKSPEYRELKAWLAERIK